MLQTLLIIYQQLVQTIQACQLIDMIDFTLWERIKIANKMK